MSLHDWAEQQRSWKLVLLGFLAIPLGIAVVVFPTEILSARVLDIIFGQAKPLSASVTAVAALFSLVAVVAIDGLANLIRIGATGKIGSRIRGIVGVAVAITTILWPDQTVVVALELIAIWAILVGVLEITYTIYSHETGKDRALLIIAAIALMAIGVVMMKSASFGAVLVSVVVGIAAAARGISLIMLGLSRRPEGKSEKQPLKRRAA